MATAKYECPVCEFVNEIKEWPTECTALDCQSCMSMFLSTMYDGIEEDEAHEHE